MPTFEPQLSTHEPQRTAIGKGEVGEMALRQRYPNAEIEVIHDWSHGSYYRYRVSINYTSITVEFNIRDILKMNGKSISIGDLFS